MEQDQENSTNFLFQQALLLYFVLLAELLAFSGLFWVGFGTLALIIDLVTAY
ncbi:MAG: hypothetical protein WAQ98_07620 [Blastocatellia bacterium]